jgi:hypothetical protein
VHAGAIPLTFEYLRIYAFELANITTPRRQDESHRTFTRRVMYTSECTQREVRVVLLQPGIEWVRVWNDLHNTRASEGARSAWYMVVHDIFPTHFRLHRIRLVDSEDFFLRGKQDTTLHRLTECGLGQEIWEWTRSRLAAIHRTDRRHIPSDWLL